MKVRASHVKQWILCPRRWAFGVGGESTEETPALALGTRVHAAIEARLADPKAAIDVDVAKILGPALPWLESLDVVDVERHWEATIGGIEFEGTIDLVARIGGDTVVVDHKTSSNPERYGHDADSLAQDPQAVLYSHVVCTDRVIWSYMATKGRPRHRLVHATPVVPEARVLPIAREMMRALDSGVPAHRQPPNPGSCRAFGRPCPHIARCTDIRPSLTGRRVDVSIDDLLKKARATNSAPTPAPTPAQLNPDAEPPPETAGPPPEAAEPPPAHHTGRVLYEGCVPIGAADVPRDAMAIALEADRMVSVGHDVPSYKAIRFGEGPAHLIAAARELIADHDGPIVVYSPHAAVVCDIMPALIEWCDLHVRAVR